MKKEASRFANGGLDEDKFLIPIQKSEEKAAVVAFLRGCKMRIKAYATRR
jgi:hypothetical protein